MHLSVQTQLIVITLYCLYLSALVRCLPYNLHELVTRADILDVDPIVEDADGADEDGTTAVTGTQDTASDTSTGKLSPNNVTTCIFF